MRNNRAGRRSEPHTTASLPIFWTYHLSSAKRDRSTHDPALPAPPKLNSGI
jgi:hypothetical protein